jgi:CheY-like chemotaxis protein
MDETKVEVKKDFVKQIFELGNVPKTSDITDDNIIHAIANIRSVINPLAENDFSPTSNNILVIDDIGVVTYQLKVLFKSLGYNVHVARDIFTGINEFSKSNFSYVIMDLFVSTEQEGYTLLNETKKMITKNRLTTKIVVITASSKAENKVKCINGGADYFVKKDAGWQDKLVEIIDGAKEEL